MDKSKPLKMVTANALDSGEVVYLSACNAWVTDCRHGEVLADEHRAALRLEHALHRQSQVVGPYLAVLAMGENGPEPVHFRERFRARGPSNRPHGKQTEADHVSLQ